LTCLRRSTSATATTAMRVPDTWISVCASRTASSQAPVGHSGERVEPGRKWGRAPPCRG
jgi:hypothetical protein